MRARVHVVLALCLLCFLSSAIRLNAQNLNELYNFTSYPNSDPFVSGLTTDPQGNIYGILASGGSGSCNSGGIQAGCGEIYELVNPGSSFGQWTLKVLYDFQGGSDGCSPLSQLAIDGHHNLYGVSYNNSCAGSGSIYELSPTTSGPWKLQVLYSGAAYSTYPGPIYSGVLALDPTGNIYATTESSVIELHKPSATGAPWNFQELAWTGGGNSGLLYSNGVLYGTTIGGGQGYGSVYEVSQANNTWSAQEVLSFTGGAHDYAINNIGQLSISADKAGNLYGITQCANPYPSSPQLTDCGTIYELQKQSGGNWQRTTLHTFDGTDGAAPMTISAFPDGEHILGYTFTGTGPASQGAVFHMAAPGNSKSPWTFNEYTFTAPLGYPDGNVVVDDSGLGVYMTPQGTYGVVDVQDLVQVNGPYTAAGEISTPACINASYPASGQVQFTNMCSGRVDFWSCAQSTASSLNACSAVNDISAYQKSYLDSLQSVTLTITTDSHLSAVANALECKQGEYPVLVTDTQGAQHLDCGWPHN